MSNQFLKLRRSSVPGKIPTTSSLEFGEIALNTYDGLAFIKKSGSSGEEVIAIGATATISGSQYFIPVFSGSGVTESTIFQSGSFIGFPNATAPLDPTNPDLLFISASGIETYNLISAHSDLDNYVQINVQNFSSGITASADIVASNNTATETTNYINMGINGDGYNIPDGIGQQNDAYLYSTGENLLIGNASYGKKVIIFNGTGSALDNARVFIVPEGTVGINAQDPNISNPESLLVEPIAGASNPTDFNNLIIGKGTIHENYLQLNMTNLGTGSAASSDIVATNDIGDETSYYIDMGVNSSGYNTPNAVGTASDAYLYSTAEHLHIGNASAGMPIMFFAGGIDAEANRKLELWPDNRHIMTGSLEASEGFTGSLYGTASWARNALTASSADNLVIRGGLTGSDALFTGTITAQRLNVQYITSSTEFITGSTKFGTQLTDTHQFTGSVSITGSLTVNGSLNATASWAQNAVSASYVPSTAIVGDLSRIATGSVTASVGVGTGSFQLTSGSSTFLLVNNNGNALIGSTADSGDRLQVTGSTLLKGSGNTIATTALTVQNSDAANILRVRNDGKFFLGSSATPLLISTMNRATTGDTITGSGLRFEVSEQTTTSFATDFLFQGTNITATSGNETVFLVSRNVIPTSGTAIVNQISTNVTVNQTGGANGITRGLYVNPTLTSAADWRSIEWTNNSGSGWGLYGAGTAPNYLAGSLGIGSTSLASSNLRVSKNISGSTQASGILVDGVIQSDVTTNANSFFSLPSLASGASITAISHYFAEQGTISGTSINQYGFRVSSVFTGATNNYGFYGNIPSGSNRWNLYMNGTAANYLAGNLLLGSTTDGGQILQVTGAARITGSLTVTGSLNAPSITGSLFGTASWALNAVTASFVPTASLTGNFFAQGGNSFGTTALLGTNDSQSLQLETSGSVRMTISGSNGFIGIGTTTPTKTLDVSGSIIIRGVITGSVGSGTLTLGADTANTPAINLSGYFVSTGAVSISNSNARAFNLILNSQNLAGYSAALNGISWQSLTQDVAYFRAGSTINITDAGAGNKVAGFLFDPTITAHVSTSLYAFRSNLAASASADRWNIYIEGSAPNYLSGSLSIGTIATGSFALNVSGSGRFTNNVEVTGSMNITGSLSVSGAVSTNAGFYVSNNSMNFGPNGANSLSLGNSAGSLSLSSTVLSLGSNTTTQTNLYGLIRINSSSLSAGIAVQVNQAVNNTSGWQTVVASPTGSYRAAFFDYVAFSGSIGRAGIVTTFWSASATEFYENYTEDLGGSTTGVVLQTAISASQIVLQATASSAAWTIRSLVRLL